MFLLCRLQLFDIDALSLYLILDNMVNIFCSCPSVFLTAKFENLSKNSLLLSLKISQKPHLLLTTKFEDLSKLHFLLSTEFESL